jgi:SAM-dependent methyltransferase
MHARLTARHPPTPSANSETSKNNSSATNMCKLSFYSHVILPRLYDCIMDRPFLANYRREQLAGVSGQILEIGIGTGLNLPHYPQHVRKITTVDPNPGMNKMLVKRIEQTGIEVDQRVISSEALPFDDCTFDYAISTLTLCSIPNVEQAIGEAWRVLKSGGRFVFFDHGLSPDSKVRRWQHRLNFLQKRFADGCRLDLDIREALSRQPFTWVEVDNFYLEKTPRTHGYIYRGSAVK